MAQASTSSITTDTGGVQSSSLPKGVIAGVVIGCIVILILGIIITVTGVHCYYKSKRPQNLQVSRNASATATSEFQSTHSQQASAPVIVEKAAEPPPSYTTAQQQYLYPYPGQQYEMQPYPQYPAAPGDPSTNLPYPVHGTYPQQYYPAVDDATKYYAQQMQEQS